MDILKFIWSSLFSLKQGKINIKGETSFWKERRITSCEHTSLVNSYVKTLESRWKICHRNLIKGYSKSAINIFGKFVQLLQGSKVPWIEKYSQEKRGILENNLLMKDIKHLWCSKISKWYFEFSSPWEHNWLELSVIRSTLDWVLCNRKIVMKTDFCASSPPPCFPHCILFLFHFVKCTAHRIYSGEIEGLVIATRCRKA